MYKTYLHGTKSLLPGFGGGFSFFSFFSELFALLGGLSSVFLAGFSAGSLISFAASFSFSLSLSLADDFFFFGWK